MVAIFSNLAAKCKVYISKVEAGDDSAASLWNDILLSWAAQGTNEKLAGIGKEHFKERVEKVKKGKSKNTKEQEKQKKQKLQREFLALDRPMQ